MEDVLAREGVELPRYQERSAARTSLVCIDRDEAIPQVLNIQFDVFCRPRRLVHVGSQRLDVKTVTLQCVADFVFELIDDRKVRKERENVFYFEQIRLLQEVHSTGSIGWRQKKTIGTSRNRPQIPLTL